MKVRGLIALFAAVYVIATSGPVLAHHSFAAEFDVEKPVTLVGAVTKVEWTNPHAWFFIDVKQPDGTVANWGIEMGSINTLIRYGWFRETMKCRTFSLGCANRAFHSKTCERWLGLVDRSSTILRARSISAGSRLISRATRR